MAIIPASEIQASVKDFSISFAEIERVVNDAIQAWQKSLTQTGATPDVFRIYVDFKLPMRRTPGRLAAEEQIKKILREAGYKCEIDGRSRQCCIWTHLLGEGLEDE